MSEEPFGLLELGSNSLKFYRVKPEAGGRYSIQTHKRTWKVAHEFFREGRLTEKSADEILEALGSVERIADGIPLQGMLAVATGVFREIGNLHEIAARTQKALGLRLRVIRGEDEARLMAKCYETRPGQESTLLGDLGGASLEWVWIRKGASPAWGSVPLGAIRNHYLFGALKDAPEELLRRSREYCRSCLEALPIPAGTPVTTTGGTAKALARLLESTTIRRATLNEILQGTLRDGPPSELKPERREVFLPGLIILDELLGRCGMDRLECASTSVRDGMAYCLIRLLAKYRRDQLHSTLLLHTSQIGGLSET
jgi:exopolyphosphatase/guanosine-5'-triphosphate,3'-diphosphate pyrophosphatase